MTLVHEVQWLLLGLNQSFNRVACSYYSLADWLHFFPYIQRRRIRNAHYLQHSYISSQYRLLSFLGFPLGFSVITLGSSNSSFFWFFLKIFFPVSGKGKQTAFPLSKSFIQIIISYKPAKSECQRTWIVPIYWNEAANLFLHLSHMQMGGGGL